MLSTYETRVVLLLEKGEQLAKEPSIEENDRTRTETDTKSLRERWDKLKKDEEEQKKRLVRVMCRKFECREVIHYKTQTGTSCEKNATPRPSRYVDV